MFFTISLQITFYNVLAYYILSNYGLLYSSILLQLIILNILQSQINLADSSYDLHLAFSIMVIISILASMNVLSLPDSSFLNTLNVPLSIMYISSPGSPSLIIVSPATTFLRVIT